MIFSPTLRTARLLLRPLQPTDAAEVQRLAGDKDVSAGTLSIPHPYEDGMAQDWIAKQVRESDQGAGITLAIEEATERRLMGAIGLHLTRLHRHALLGYWLGRPYWNRGFATEAVRAVLAYGFATLDVHRIYAGHFSANPASGRVLLKAGLRYEGRMRQHYYRFGRYLDVEWYGILKEEYGEGPSQASRPG